MVRVITDSGADFEPWEHEAMGITHIPLYVYFGETEYQENVNLSKNEFYELLQKGEHFPRTSLPSPETIARVFQEAKDAGDEAVVVPLSSGLSGTCQSMMMVRDMIEYEDCYIVDSLTGTGGQRLLVEQAVKMRDEGKCAKEIVAELESMRDRLVLYTCMDTLEFLMKGGRISKATYAVGTLANVKPIMHVDKEGKPEIPAKMIGMRRAMNYLRKRIAEETPDPKYPVYVMYTHNRENGEKLATLLREDGFDIPDSCIVNVGAVIGTHIGPNACAIVYIGKEK